MQGMSYTERKWLICLDGTQYVQATELLYHLLLHADGATPVDEIARLVSAETGRAVSGDEMRWLIVNKLGGSGLIEWPAPADAKRGGAETPPGAGNTLPPSRILAIKHRFPLLPYPVTAPAAALLHHLYWPPLIVLVVIAAAAINVWIYRGSDFVNGLVTLFYRPELVLFLFAVDTITRLFHELGHASALRRAGARHGTIGFALYVFFPVYYTDVSHAYRLNRLQRIRVDLGGIYFDLISIIVLYTAYRFTGYAPLILMITLIGLGILRQFTPFIRFDGYYLIADLMGVPDPMALLVPAIRDHLPWRSGKPKSTPHLHRIAMLILWGYVLLIVAFLTRPLLLLGVAGGAVLQQLPQSGLAIVSEFVFAFRHHDLVTQLAATLELVFWLFIPLGLGLFAFGLLRMFARGQILLARALYRRFSAYVSAVDIEAPAATTSFAVAPANRPTPLDGLGRPVVRTADAAGTAGAAVEDARAHIAAATGAGPRELVQDLERVYSRRLQEMAAEITRLVEWTDAVERDRDALRYQVQTLESVVGQLTTDLRRIGGEMITAASSADHRLAAAAPADQDTAAAAK